MNLSLTLDYALPEGRLSPYLDALREGRALASRCNECGRVLFPARILCAECGTLAQDWIGLSGAARVIHRTDGTAGSHALVRFDGAHAATMVALINPDETNEAGWLIAPQGERPGLWLRLETEDADDV